MVADDIEWKVAVKHRILFTILLALIVYAYQMGGAHAYSSYPISDTISCILNLVIYDIGPGVASLAVLLVGGMTITGRMSVQTLLTIGAGISVLFSAVYIGAYIFGVTVSDGCYASGYVYFW